MDREELLAYQPKVESKRIPLVITYHHKFAGFGKVMQSVYNQTINKFPDLKKVIPEQPLIAYRRTKNIKDKLVRSNHHRNSCQVSPASSSHWIIGRSTWEDKINTSGTITNVQTNRTFKIAGGPAKTTGCIYAAECTKHHVIYVGQTGRLLSSRFNGHRSDTKLRPEACGLDMHFHNSDCCIDSDLRISVLEHVSGSQALREYREEVWISRLQTFTPGGLNTKYHSDFGPIYHKLFK